MIDLADYDTRRAEDGEDMPVKYPGSDTVMRQDDDTPVALTLAGTDSQRYRATRRMLVKRRQEASARNKDTVPLEVLETESLETVAGCLIGWKGIVLDGETVEFSAHNARRVLTRLPWLVEQAEAFLHDRRNFMNGLPNGLSH
jgi:hypothetical protein